MAQYTVEAFQWTGTFYNAVYNVSYIAVLDDDDPSYDGSGDASETISINGGPFNPTTGSPYAIDVSFTDTSGTPHVETFYFFNTGGNWYFIPGPGSAFTVGATLGSYQSHTVGWDYADVACFTAGTLIETDMGLVKVENLSVGDRVRVKNGAYRPLRLKLSRTIANEELKQNPKLAPIRISAHALGNGLPHRDLLVSRQHRLLCASSEAKQMFGKKNALIAAVRLLNLQGIEIDQSVTSVEYFHLVFDSHQIIFANGALTESFLICDRTLSGLSADAQDEIFAIFPNLKSSQNSVSPAALIPKRQDQKALVQCLTENQKEFTDPTPWHRPATYVQPVL